MKIYLAGRYSRRDQLRAFRGALERAGHVVTSRWLDTTWEAKDDSGSSAAPPEYREKHAVEDVEDVLAAECLVAFTEEGRTNGRGGRHVEYGIALGTGRRVVVIGGRENLFHHHPRVEFHATQASALEALTAEARR